VISNFKQGIAILLAMHSLAGNASSDIDKLMATVKSDVPAEIELSVVREAILKEAATTLGARAGMVAKGCEIKNEIEKRAAPLDKRFRFSDLVMGRGLLPPVISEAKDAVALTEKALRWSSRVYTLDEPARLVINAPTWRDWLYVGLPVTGCDNRAALVSDTLASVHRPTNAAEEKYFRNILAKSYEQGREAAESVFDTNLARLNRSYAGMRLYFDLYQRGIVSAPVIVRNTDVVNNDDPNVLLIGDTLIRITMQPGFIADPDKWVALDHDDRGAIDKLKIKRPTPTPLAQRSAPREAVTPPAQQPAVKAWDIRKSDGMLSNMLKRWAAREGWTVLWTATRDVEIAGDGTINNADFYDAVLDLVGQLRTKGIALQAFERPGRVLEIRSTGPVKGPGK
jgi:defect-in-organelle-trafficking protein DotC